MSLVAGRMRIVKLSLSAARATDVKAAPTHNATHRRTEIRRTYPAVLCARGAARRTGIPEFSRTVMGKPCLARFGWMRIIFILPIILILSIFTGPGQRVCLRFAQPLGSLRQSLTV